MKKCARSSMRERKNKNVQERGNVMNGIIITGMICGTLILLSLIGKKRR